jgi:NRAMP (natural resistance-associated macrophage protein)-like metal ion transporter
MMAIILAVEIRDPLLRRIGIGPAREPAPARALKEDEAPVEEAATGGPQAGRTTLAQARRRGLFGYLQLLGPGLVTGASDDDPSGIGTYSQVGAQFGYGLLWTALFTFPLMAAIQELCARIALQTGVGLGTVLRRRFPAWIVGSSILALFIANTINLGADLGAVAAGVRLLSGDRLPSRWIVVPAAALVVGLQFRVSYATIFRIFKWLTLALFAYVVTAFFAHPALIQLAVATVVPHVELSRDYITALVAVLGTTISPYLFFWQASSEVEEMKAAGQTTELERKGTTHAEMQAARFDIVSGMGFSQVIMYCIILTAGAVLFTHGKHGIASADQAAAALAPFAGPLASSIFAVGFIGTGLLAIPILSGSAAYAIKEFLGMGGSLAIKPRYRPTFYGVLLLSMAVGVVMNFLNLNPIAALFWSAVINGVIAVPLLVLIVLVGANREVMKRRVSGRLSLTLTWVGTALMAVAAAAMIVTMLPIPGLGSR